MVFQDRNGPIEGVSFNPKSICGDYERDPKQGFDSNYICDSCALRGPTGNCPDPELYEEKTIKWARKEGPLSK